MPHGFRLTQRLKARERNSGCLSEVEPGKLRVMDQQEGCSVEQKEHQAFKTFLGSKQPISEPGKSLHE
jgi:hypothetical protein